MFTPIGIYFMPNMRKESILFFLQRVYFNTVYYIVHPSSLIFFFLPSCHVFFEKQLAMLATVKNYHSQWFIMRTSHCLQYLFYFQNCIGQSWYEFYPFFRILESIYQDSSSKKAIGILIVIILSFTFYFGKI